MALALVPQKGLTTRNTHVKYESSKVMANVKVFCSQTDMANTIYAPDLSMRRQKKPDLCFDFRKLFEKTVKI